jgi:hypothetical protein
MVLKLKMQTVWSPELAYAIGIIATDGNLSPDKSCINITSKDLEIIQNVRDCLRLTNKIGRKGSGSTSHKNYYVLQFRNKTFYSFLNNIGLTSNKSMTIGKLDVPESYFMDFLRGCIDGDGNINISFHPESSKPQLRLRLCSASLSFVIWIKDQINSGLKIKSGWIYSNTRGMHVLSYGKKDSIKILQKMYYSNVKYYLSRKYEKIILFIDNTFAEVA